MDYIDVFLYRGVTRPKHMTDHVREEFTRFRDEGKVRYSDQTCIKIAYEHPGKLTYLTAIGSKIANYLYIKDLVNYLHITE